MPQRVLIVDDHEDSLSIFSSALAGAGYDVITATDGQEALQKVLKTRPDLVLLDLILPEIDGFAVCDTLKYSPSFRSIPVLMISAWTDSHSILQKQSQRAGAEELLMKPIAPKDLVTKVRKYLGGDPLPLSAA
ncbi:MAG: response regulator [Candidatus Manganitrophus sp.]|nr:response regulator [Candidatus Manganitrophus sp.]